MNQHYPGDNCDEDEPEHRTEGDPEALDAFHVEV